MNAAALREAAAWRLLGLLFECPRNGWLAQVEALASEVADPGLRSAAESSAAATESFYHSMFGPGGAVPPREVSYRNTLQPGQLLGELRAYYEAFAYQPSISEPPDHVAVETGFVAYLKLKEIYARERGRPDQADIAAEAAQQIIADHLSALAGPLAEAFAGLGIAYLASASAALLQRVGPPRSTAWDAAGPAADPWSEDEPT